MKKGGGFDWELLGPDSHRMTSGTLREPGGRPTDLCLGGWFLESDILEVSEWPITPLLASC